MKKAKIKLDDMERRFPSLCPCKRKTSWPAAHMVPA